MASFGIPQVSAFGFSGPDWGGGLISREWSQHEAQDAQDRGFAIMAAQHNFQREMSNTAYQRAVADMQAAGLNPMLAYSQGGASTPSGGMFQPPMAKIDIPGVGGSVSGQTESQIGLQEAQSRRERQQELRIMVERQLDQWELAFRQSKDEEGKFNYQKLREAEAAMAATDALTSVVEYRMAREALEGKLTEGEIDRTTYGVILRYIDRAMDALRGGSSAYGSTRPRGGGITIKR